MDGWMKKKKKFMYKWTHNAYNIITETTYSICVIKLWQVGNFFSSHNGSQTVLISNAIQFNVFGSTIEKFTSFSVSHAVFMKYNSFCCF